VLALKLLVVPACLLLLSLAARRWGPRVAGWLAGLPIVAGPILLFLALEQGAAFASRAATSALAAVSATVAFIVAYAHAAQRAGWPSALGIGMATWLAVAFAVSRVEASLGVAVLLAGAALFAAPRSLPRTGQETGGRAVARAELGARMLAGALLTVGVTFAAEAVGPRWSGSLAIFPVLASVLAVFSHRGQGPVFATALLRAMTTGMVSLAAFCLVVAVALPTLGTPAAFALSVVATLLVQAITGWVRWR
jgi:hypothetical protein